jgi:hypothetical protein
MSVLWCHAGCRVAARRWRGYGILHKVLYTPWLIVIPCCLFVVAQAVVNVLVDVPPLGGRPLLVWTDVLWMPRWGIRERHLATANYLVHWLKQGLWHEPLAPGSR